MDRLAVLQEYLKEDPDDAFTRFALAQELRARGQLDAAVQTFEGLVAAQPDYVGTYYHLGKLFEELGRTEDAILAYRAGIEHAAAANDLHARAELQSALMEAQGVGFD